MTRSDIGLIGLSTMGQNLALNIERNGFKISVFNRTAEITRDFTAQKTKGKKFFPFYSLEKFISSLEKPKKIILLIKAGEPVDEMIKKLLPFLEKGDLLIDGGNSFFRDTERRQEFLKEKGIELLGMGVSGGEEGALKGPSLMLGGERRAFKKAEDILVKISAKFKGEPCCTYLGPRGAGHFVKMVHNGIEYGIMQALGEIYDFLKNGLDLSQQQIIREFTVRQKSLFASYLMEISLEVLNNVDSETSKPLIESILDEAEQKGTGKWTTQTALDLGVPILGISSAVEARIISSWKKKRERLSSLFPKKGIEANKKIEIQLLFDAFLASILMIYQEGFFLLRQGSEEFGYQLNLAQVAKTWRAGCIIRAKLTEKIASILEKSSENKLLLETSFFQNQLKKLENSWREVISVFLACTIPCPTMSACLAEFDSLRQKRLESASLIQGLRDRFGSHGFRRIDKKGDFHVD
ncbi:MAG TPA: NADP-dependent phosphogluconate dehydrogenase [Candidatus Bathyarchaeia archaeon]|nr:NADP-dependent phosphogluconate dehydrogenase [Candidatus Bathyarchaeia archaeon]